MDLCYSCKSVLTPLREAGTFLLTLHPFPFFSASPAHLFVRFEPSQGPVWLDLFSQFEKQKPRM